MIVNVLKNEKNHLEVELENLTIAELIRNSLWDDSAVTLAAWKREHPTKHPVLIIRTSGKSAKKALTDSIERMKKLNEKILAEVKKIVKK